MDHTWVGHYAQGERARVFCKDLEALFRRSCLASFYLQRKEGGEGGDPFVNLFYHP